MTDCPEESASVCDHGVTQLRIRVVVAFRRQSGTIRIALLESMLTHIRGLTEFLYGSRNRTDRHDADIWPADSASSWLPNDLARKQRLQDSLLSKSERPAALVSLGQLCMPMRLPPSMTHVPRTFGPNIYRYGSRARKSFNEVTTMRRSKRLIITFHIYASVFHRQLSHQDSSRHRAPRFDRVERGERVRVTA